MDNQDSRTALIQEVEAANKALKLKEETIFSRTALMTAYVRAYHAEHDAPKIFNDLLAHRLLTKEERIFFNNYWAKYIQFIDPARAASCPDQATALAWSLQASAGSPINLSRARYTEDILEHAVRQGVKQYVILGAGMDTFAFRRPEMLEHLQVFEVDHPAMQVFKLSRLAELGWEYPAQLHFVPLDFNQEQERLVAALTRSFYDQKAPGFFSWLGVTYYLTRDAVFTTLRDIADIAPAGSTIIFDYMDTDAFVPERAAPRVQHLMEGVRQIGEPMKTGFNPSTLAVDLEGVGLRLHENLNPTNIQERYFKGRTDGYYACEHVHFAWAVVE